jgi:site-specific recombinase XerD
MSAGETTKWLGGYVRHGKRGPAYVIERWIDGARFHVSTKCRTERAALKELERFETDPHNYTPGGVAPDKARERLELSEDLILQFRDWMLTRERPTTDAHATRLARILVDWMRAFDGADLRDVTLTQLKDELAKRRNKGLRVEAIKAFCGWLRRERGLLKHHEDPTVDLRGPKTKVTPMSERMIASQDDVLKVLRWMPPESRDVMIVRIATGLHISEVRRWAGSGKMVRPINETVSVRTRAGVEVIPLLAVLYVQHKRGDEVPVPLVYPEHVEAAERLRERGYVPAYGTMSAHLRSACDIAKVPHFRQGIMRHSVVTWGLRAGAPLSDASDFVGHMDERTTRRHYAAVTMPVSAIPVLRIPRG